MRSSVVLVPNQTEPSPSASAAPEPTSLVTFATLFVAGSMWVTPELHPAQTSWSLAAISPQSELTGIVATTVSVMGSMRTMALILVTPTQSEPAPTAIHWGPESEADPRWMRSTTFICAGSIFATEPVGLPLWFATQTYPSKTATPTGPLPPGSTVPTTRLVTGSIRVSLTPGKLVTQMASAETASTEGGSSREILAMTLSVVGSILVTDRLGPLETQIEPKPASTSRGVDCRISATTLPTGAGPEALVEDWPQAVTDMTARMIRTVFNCRQPTPEEYSASSLAPRCEPLPLKAG